MPEGDTIHKAAARLRPALIGAPLVRFEAARLVASPDLRPRPGMVIETVDAVGKHLMVGFDAGVVLRVHLGMPGSWHLYHPGQRWQKPPHRARVVLEVPDWVAVCFSAPTVSVHRRGAGDSPVAHLGPDLCRAEHTPDEVAALGVARLEHLAGASADVAGAAGADVGVGVDVAGRAALAEGVLAAGTRPAGAGRGVASAAPGVLAGRTIAEVLLDQRVVAGIGNVYKSEVLWACGIDPFRPVEAVPATDRHRLLATAARLLRANLGQTRRSTLPGGGLAVFGRAGAPCRRCAGTVRSRVHGEQNRRTFWCPGCQS